MPSVRRHIWVATHRGLVRASNQDRAATPTRRSVGDDDDWDEPFSAASPWVAVADGMGGHEAGNIASDVAIDAACQSLPDARTERDMSEVALLANRMTFQAMFSGEGRVRMGSTLVAASIWSNAALVVNVGDSRAYLLSKEKLHLLSQDDTLPSGLPGRRQHMLTQSIGGLAFQAPISPHVARLPFAPEDLLLLCSDGLTDMVSDGEIAQILRANPRDPVRSLVAAALDCGGRDNITAVAIGPVSSS